MGIKRSKKVAQLSIPSATLKDPIIMKKMVHGPKMVPTINIAFLTNKIIVK